jgi:hypothetical protein
MGWAENAVRDLDVSSPEQGKFNVECDQLKLTHFEKLNNMPLVVAFCVPVDRVADFIAGEEERGLCKLLKNKTYKSDDVNTPVSGELYLCCFGKERKKNHQAKAASAPVLETAPGKRRSKIVHHESSKLGCTYSLSWREFSREGERYAAVFVRNGGLHVRDGETVILHGPASASCDLPLTEECRDFVRQLILQGNQSEHIIQSAHTPVKGASIELVLLVQSCALSMHCQELVDGCSLVKISCRSHVVLVKCGHQQAMSLQIGTLLLKVSDCGR